MTASTGRLRARRGRRFTGVVGAAALLVSVLPAAASAQELPDEDDPRVGLEAGWTDPGVASLGVDLLAHRDRPEGFYDPGNPGNFSFAQSDLALTDTHAFVGSFNGFNIYDITSPDEPELVNATVCPGGQGDPSIHGDLLFISVEQPRARVDCGADPTVGERFQGVRIFDVSDVTEPVQVAAVQTCRGSHTHTLVPGDDDTMYVYVSGTTAVRQDATGVQMGCATSPVGSEPLPAPAEDARWRIDVIEVPLDAPEDAELVGGPRLFADDEGNINGLQNEPPSENHPSGENWGPVPITDACHDITAYPAIGLAAGACEGNGILIDITDPANPERVAEAADPNFAYWHSATFSDDGSKVVFTDEWGGGVGAKCRATDQLEWGANAIFDIVDGADGPELQHASYYKMPAVQTDSENCVAHNGNLLPHPERDLMVQAWYQGGMSIWDFTDASAPFEIAYFDRGPIDADNLVLGGFWSTYFHNGHIYGAEIARGFDVFELTPTEDLTQDDIDAINANYQSETNAQLQQPIGAETRPQPPGPEDNPACDAVESRSFPDVAGPPHGDNIGCVAGYGIAKGRADGTYQPLADVRRDQMASFLTRTLRVSGVELPAEPEDRFSDDDGSTHELAINQLAELGIVQGRGGDSYAPLSSVTRAQMASFLVRTLEEVLGRDLEPTGSGPFTDTAGSPHTDNIDVAAELDIAKGRTATRFEPNMDVRRDQMGSFIARSLRVLDAEGVTLTPVD